MIESGSKVVQPAPALDIPESGEHVWEWYFDLSNRLRRVRDGACEPIAPTEFLAWREITGSIVYPAEYDILGSMDLAFVDEMNKELSAYRERENDRRAQEAKKRPRR